MPMLKSLFNKVAYLKAYSILLKQPWLAIGYVKTAAYSHTIYHGREFIHAMCLMVPGILKRTKKYLKGNKDVNQNCTVLKNSESWF